jgi:hypothetical protein
MRFKLPGRLLEVSRHGISVIKYDNIELSELGENKGGSGSSGHVRGGGSGSYEPVEGEAAKQKAEVKESFWYGLTTCTASPFSSNSSALFRFLSARERLESLLLAVIGGAGCARVGVDVPTTPEGGGGAGGAGGVIAMERRFRQSYARTSSTMRCDATRGWCKDLSSPTVEPKRQRRTGMVYGSELREAHKDELRELFPYLWPKDRPLLRLCFVLSGIFLIMSKLCNVASPIALKVAIDAVSNGRQGLAAGVP